MPRTFVTPDGMQTAPKCGRRQLTLALHCFGSEPLAHGFMMPHGLMALCLLKVLRRKMERPELLRRGYYNEAVCHT